MKYFIMTFVTVLTIVNIYAQSITMGYYITHANDTVVTPIKFPAGFFGQNNFTNKIEVVDSVNGTTRFTPGDIKGYGFSADGYKYIFLSKPVKDGSYKFLSPVFIGSKASLYQYGINTSGSGYSLASQQVFYTFEKPNNQYLFLVGRTTKMFKNALKEFFNEDPDVQRLIDERFKYWNEMRKDLLDLMRTVNKK